MARHLLAALLALLDWGLRRFQEMVLIRVAAVSILMQLIACSSAPNASPHVNQDATGDGPVDGGAKEPGDAPSARPDAPGRDASDCDPLRDAGSACQGPGGPCTSCDDCCPIASCSGTCRRCLPVSCRSRAIYDNPPGCAMTATCEGHMYTLGCDGARCHCSIDSIMTASFDQTSTTCTSINQ